MNWIRSHSDIITHILSIEQSILNPIIANSEIISYLKELLWTYRKNIASNGFLSNEQEIEFFKNSKPVVLSYLIQYRKQLNFEVDYKNYTANDHNKIIDKEISIARNFLSLHHTFIIYMELERTSRDDIYFLRKPNVQREMPNSTVYDYDKVFCTSYDCLWAEIMGTNRYIEYLNSKIYSNLKFSGLNKKAKNINWTSSKAALTELAIALKFSGSLNHGNISFKETVIFLQDLFKIDLGEFNHTAMRLKNRSNPTKFVDSLKVSVENWIEKSDL